MSTDNDTPPFEIRPWRIGDNPDLDIIRQECQLAYGRGLRVSLDPQQLIEILNMTLPETFDHDDCYHSHHMQDDCDRCDEMTEEIEELKTEVKQLEAEISRLGKELDGYSD